MGNKRANNSASSKKKRSKTNNNNNNNNNVDILKSMNQFAALPSDEDSDSSIIFDYSNKKDNEIVLKDSDNDSDEVVIESEAESEVNDQEASISNENGKDNKGDQKVLLNEVTGNHDFIEFGFSSSENEQEGKDDDYSDDGLLSDDQSGNTHSNMNLKVPYAWVKGHDHSTQREIADWLTMEMKDFVNYISPSKEEIVLRNNIIGSLKKEISSFWKGTEVHVFGSSATDLYLPGSDIDLVVISRTGDYEQRSRLYQLSSFLRNKKMAKNIEVIAKAKVPIIKFVTPESNINIDISFERTNGIEAAKRIRKWLDTTPALRELVLVVKQFLRSRKLNNVHVGGLGGYSTIILCYHFLKLHPRLSTHSMSAMDNLGALLIEFFELYGRNFSFDNLIISVDPDTGEARYLKKSRYPVLNTSKNPYSLVIQDPADKDNNISRSSYNLRDIKKAFGGAFSLLVDKCYTLNSASYKDRVGRSILGDIIKYKGKERDFNDDRDKVINSALVNHKEEVLSSELSRKDETFYSELSVSSEDDTCDASQIVPSNTGSLKDSVKRTVSEFMSIESEESSSDNDKPTQKKQKSALNKDTKRDYWMQKGLDM